MTYQEFLQALEQTPRDWYIVKPNVNTVWAGSIRRHEPGKGHGPLTWEQCPITSLTTLPIERSDWAARELGLSESDTRAITLAADGDGYPSVRADLLRACGLSEGV